jgi:hypothetical protein
VAAAGKALAPVARIVHHGVEARPADRPERLAARPKRSEERTRARLRAATFTAFARRARRQSGVWRPSPSLIGCRGWPRSPQPSGGSCSCSATASKESSLSSGCARGVAAKPAALPWASITRPR